MREHLGQGVAPIGGHRQTGPLLPLGDGAGMVMEREQAPAIRVSRPTAGDRIGYTAARAPAAVVTFSPRAGR
jgi:hypothetical protein